MKTMKKVTALLLALMMVLSLRRVRLREEKRRTAIPSRAKKRSARPKQVVRR